VVKGSTVTGVGITVVVTVGKGVDVAMDLSRDGVLDKMSNFSLTPSRIVISAGGDVFS
jgi:hypothetical protein